LRRRAGSTYCPPGFEADADEWYAYGTGGRICDIHIDGEHARIDGVTYALRD